MSSAHRSAWRAGALAAGVLALIGGRLSAAAPSAAEQARFIEAARQIALEYGKSLPDFLCTQTIRRYRIFFTGRERLLDTLTVEVSFERQSDRYELTSVNGQGPGPLPDAFGALSTGEFGTNLLRVFGSKAEFHFERWTTITLRPAAVYSYRVARSESPYQLILHDSVAGKESSATVGLRGEVVFDRESHAVLRFQYRSAEVPASFPMRSDSTVEYDYVALGNKNYLLPVKATLVTISGVDRARNEVEFHSYRKFTSESKVTFADPRPEP